MKTSEYGTRDLAGLLEFTTRFPAYRPLVLSDEAGLRVAERAGIRAMPWRGFLAANGPG